MVEFVKVEVQWAKWLDMSSNLVLSAGSPDLYRDRPGLTGGEHRKISLFNKEHEDVHKHVIQSTREKSLLLSLKSKIVIFMLLFWLYSVLMIFFCTELGAVTVLADESSQTGSITVSSECLVVRISCNNRACYVMADGQQLEQTVAKNEEDFKEMSETIRKELARFDRQKAQDFKSTIANYLQCMVNYQQKVHSHLSSHGNYDVH